MYHDYLTRTFQHIHRVQNNMLTLLTEYSTELCLSPEAVRELAHTVMNHDRSKFSEAQFLPYVELTKYYHQRKKLKNTDYQYPSKEVEDQVQAAIQDHYMQENHHAEREGGDVDKMSKHRLIEVICDLQAMAQEFGEGSCREFFLKTWCPKYTISISNKNFMLRVIDCFEHFHRLGRFANRASCENASNGRD